MATAPAPTAAVTRIVFYTRVSTEEQSERDTAQNQLEYLRRRFAADLADDSPNPMQLVGEYVDAGYSGALALGDRPDGKRLLEAARSGDIDAVIIYRLDRLGRSIKVLLQAYEDLERHGVAIVSATEPFDTRTSIGRFVFQLLGSIAELERETIRERMSLGRDRQVRADKFMNGPVPYGYLVDAHGDLEPNEQHIAALDMTEADVVRLIFKRLGEGESARSLARWLTARGVPSTTRYHSKRKATTAETENTHWGPWRIWRMVASPTYRGVRPARVSGGSIEQRVAPLVDDLTWHRANNQLTDNAAHPINHAIYTYLLRGRLECGLCGGSVVGNYQKNTGRLYYACLRAKGRTAADRLAEPCKLGYMRGEPIEELVLREIDEFVANPDVVLDDLRAQLRARQGLSVDRDGELRRLRVRLREIDEARRDVLALLTKRRIVESEADTSLAELADDAALIRRDIDALDNQGALADALEAQLIDSAKLLREIGTYWSRWREDNDREQMVGVVQQLVVTVRLFPKAPPARAYTFPRSNSEVQTHDHAAQLDALRLYRDGDGSAA